MFSVRGEKMSQEGFRPVWKCSGLVQDSPCDMAFARLPLGGPDLFFGRCVSVRGLKDDGCKGLLFVEALL